MKYTDGRIIDGLKVVYQPTSPVRAYRRRVSQDVGGRQEICHILVLDNAIVFVHDDERIEEIDKFDEQHPWHYSII